ncbi:MAG TPA: FkbM family methyltransferase [Gemmatimonadales bacterium]|nr:FkbM family methyltransferase [Gemmatimonadales bacterium]
MDGSLVFDLGVNNGDDTAHYLQRGHRVLGVDADPAMVAECEKRFAREIADGRLTLLNVAIAPQAGTTTFYVSHGNRGAWSSLDRHEASRGRLAVTPTPVAARTLGSLLDEYGVPFYMKIDIEGGGSACLQDLRPAAVPKYLSFEALEGRLEDLFTAARCGYTGFKLIDQLRGFRQVVPPPLHTWGLVLDTGAYLARRAIRSLPGVPRVARLVRRALRPPDRRGATGHVWGWPLSSSGPMAEETDGPWRSLEEVAYAWLYYVRKTRTASWFDVHCTHA